MPWINNLKLMPKLMLTFGVLLLVMLLQGIVAYRGLYSLNNVTTELAGHRMESIRTAGEIRGMVGEYRNSAYQGLIRASDDVKADAKKRAADLRGKIDLSIKKYPELIDNPQQKKLFDTFAKDWKTRWPPTMPSPRCWNWISPMTPWTPSSAKPVPSTRRPRPRSKH